MESDSILHHVLLSKSLKTRWAAGELSTAQADVYLAVVCVAGGKKASSPKQDGSRLGLRRAADVVEKELRGQSGGESSSDQGLFPRGTSNGSEGQ